MTREELLNIIETDHVQCGEAAALARMALAFYEWHEKTAWVQTDKRFDVLKSWGKHRADVLKEYIEHLENRITQPVPVVPNEITSASAPEVFEIAAEAERLGLRGTYASYAVGWNACRAAMLNGTNHVRK